VKLAPPPTSSRRTALDPRWPAKETPKQADRKGSPPPAKQIPTRKTSPQEANKSSIPNAKGPSITNLLHGPSLEPTTSATPSSPPLEKGRGTVTLDADIKVAAGKEEHEDLHLDLLLYKSTRQGAGPPLKSVAGRAPEERGPAERRRKKESPSKSPKRTVARGKFESTLAWSSHLLAA